MLTQRRNYTREANIDTADIAVVSHMVSKTFFRCPPLELSTCCLPSFFVISRHVYLSIYPSSILSVCTVYKQNKKAEHVSILQDCVMRNLCFLLFDFDQFIRWSKFYGFFKYVISKCVLMQFFKMESECPRLQSLFATTQMHVCKMYIHILYLLYVHRCVCTF
jgi:hypothetical protein